MNDPINWIDSLGLACPCKDRNWWDKLLCKANELLAKLNGTDKDTNTQPKPPNTTALDAAMNRSLEKGTGQLNTPEKLEALANAAETAVDTAENIGWGITGGIAGKIAKTLKNIAKIFKGVKKTTKETGLTTEVKTRPTLGVDGGTSQIIIKRDTTGAAVSKTHKVRKILKLYINIRNILESMEHRRVFQINGLGRKQ